MVNKNDSPHSPMKKMILGGKGQVTVNPDQAIIRLGVLTTGDSVTAAQTDNARISQQVLDNLKKFGNIDIKTYQYQIEKLYDYENGNRIDRGYSVRNIFEIHTGNVGQAGVIIDNAVYNGANIVDLVSFDVAAPDKYYQQALKLAVNNAYDKAKAVSTSLKIMFDPVPILITENSTQPMPFTPMFAAREGAYSTPIESGSKQIDASVTVEFSY
jgi:uncharacterized protein YggE